MSEGRACSHRLWGQRGSPAGVCGLSVKGDLASGCPTAQWPNQGLRCSDPRDVGGVLRTPLLRAALQPTLGPTPPAAAWSLPGALTALPPAEPRPHAERPWALVLHTKPLQKPRQAEGSQVLSSGGGSSWGPCSPLQADSGSLQGAPLLVLCALPWRAWGRPCPLGSAHPAAPRPRLLPLPTPGRFLCCC